MVPKTIWSPSNSSRSLPTFLRLIVITALRSSAPTASTMRRNTISISVQQANNCALIVHIPPSVLCVIGHAPKTAITVRSKRSVPPVHKDAVSVAVSTKRCWIASEATRRPKPTKKPIANAASGSNRSSPKAKIGMACVVFACDGCGVSTVKRSCEPPDKISSGCSHNEAGDVVLTQQRPFLPSF
jgi:hypothetical protein